MNSVRKTRGGTISTILASDRKGALDVAPSSWGKRERGGWGKKENEVWGGGVGGFFRQKGVGSVAQGDSRRRRGENERTSAKGKGKAPVF